MESLRRIIIIGILTLLATLCASRIIAPQARAAVSLTISKNGYYDSAAQKYYFIGEIKNVGTTPATNITISINAYDSSNNQVDIETPTPEISVLNAGAKSPFYTYCESSQASQRIDHFTATILASSESTGLPVGIQVTVDNATLDGASSFITGTLQNTGTSETDITDIYATFYNSNGTVMGVGFDQSDVLEPNDTNQFNITSQAFVLNANVTGYTITAESFVGEDNGDYISAETNGGTIPEFPSVFAIMLVLAGMLAIMIYSNKQETKRGRAMNSCG